MLPIHGNRFLARQVFLYLDLNNLDDPAKDIQVLLDKVNATTVKIIDFTAKAISDTYPDSYLANLFKNAKNVRRLREQSVQRFPSEFFTTIQAISIVPMKV